MAFTLPPTSIVYVQPRDTLVDTVHYLDVLAQLDGAADLIGRMQQQLRDCEINRTQLVIIQQSTKDQLQNSLKNQQQLLDRPLPPLVTYAAPIIRKKSPWYIWTLVGLGTIGGTILGTHLR